MKNPNSYGSITKLSGKRRRPYMVRITTGWHLEGDKAIQDRTILGYYETRQKAIKALADYNENPFDLDAMKVTFGMCYEEAKKQFTDGRVRNYMAAYKYLEPIKDKPIRSIKANDMQRCIDLCETTQQSEIKTVCHKVFDIALKNEIVDKNPSMFLKSRNPILRKEKTILSRENVAVLEENNSEWWSKLALMLLYSGMRTKELKDLDPDNIDIENRKITITVAKNKSSIRTVPIHTHALALFCDYKDFGGNLYGFTHDGLNKALKQAVGHTAHECRHTFTTVGRECGMDSLVLQRILGHTPSSITEKVYTHLSHEELINNIDMYHF